MSKTKNITKPKLIIILGPTASGKSDLAVDLARRFNGEIISADSRQVYRGMNIGSGKITQHEMRGVPHYCLDVASPRLRYTVAHFKKNAETAIKKIQAKNKIPIICGGTGQYINAVIYNWQIPAVKPNLKLRAKLEKLSADELYKKLKKLDPRRAKNIDPRNPRRLIRAIEIAEKLGAVPLLKTNSPFNALTLGPKKSPIELKRRIATRLEKRLKQGMLAEVKKLRSQGVSWQKLDDFGLEYRWLARYLQKKIPRKEMAERLKKDIEHYAKRQMIWFKKYNPQTCWIKNSQTAIRLAEKFLQS
ncbi:MAG: tRNA dimethylallyltransferase [Parcubacteria group bacterium GW2011_GWF2_44_7]|nr:MAG: tRNA dimethylallyltransferase [Parcubacteria group bacterium GW2011_GWF2_44_7]